MSPKALCFLASITLLWAHSSRLCSAVHLSPSLQAAVTAPTCPGVINSTCSRACQQHVCEALGGFYRASNNISDPWDNKDGWELTTRTPCAELIAEAAARADTAAGAAVYCSWYGISCCIASAAASGNCTVINAVVGLDLPMNNLNASLEDPAFQAAIGKLHACGLTLLNLEANNLSGEMVEKGWSSFVNLQLINVANAYVGGTIPTALRHMRNLTSITLSNNYFYGTLPAWLGELQKLQVVSMGTFAGYDESTGLTGTIPAQLGDLKNLQALILQSNFLTGTLPPQLCQDQSQLVQLSLRSNLLQGSAKAIEGCGSLIKIDISDNSFSGSLPASRNWQRLTNYQAAKNKFTGRFPIKLCRSSKLLDRLDVSHNQLSGHIPGQITLLTGMQTLRLGNNKFTGTMTENVYLLPVLKEFDMSNNLFVGTVSSQIEYTYTLEVIDFSNNTGLTGTLPPQMAFLLDLQKVSTVGTSMCCSGITKPFVTTTNASCDDPDRCKTPKLIGGEDSGTMMRCSDKQLLPCFLMFSEVALPREDYSNMRCKYIMRKTPEQAKRDCAEGEYGSYFLGDSVQYLPNMVKDSTEQSWIIDPSYHQYRECSCLQGFAPVWDSSGTMLRCDPEPAVKRRNLIIVSAISAVAGLALLAVLVLLAQLYLRTRPKWLRERFMQAKRMQGAPKCAKPGEKVTVSIVVTDVKDYSANMRQHQDLMVKAMGAHNNILRKACHAHAGYVMDQEGDSWTIAFHEPQDAVAFSLQIQQAMAQKVWGTREPSLTFNDHSLDPFRQESSAASDSFIHPPSHNTQTHHVVDMGNSMTSAGGEAARQDSGTDNNSRSLSVSSPQIAAGVGSASQQHQHLQSNEMNSSFTSSAASSSIADSSQASEELAGRTSSFSIAQLFSRQRTSRSHSYGTKQGGPDGSSQVAAATSERLAVSNQQQQLQQKDAQVSAEAPAGQDHGHNIGLHVSEGQHQGDIESGSSAVGRSNSPSSFSSSISAFLSNPSEGTADLQQGPGSSLGSSLSSAIFSVKRRGVTSALMHRLTQMAGRNVQTGAAVTADQMPVKLLQLAVRVGIASGPLPYGCTLGNCAVKHRAKKLVSEVAAGGQVLCDESTFLSIKDSLSVLGTVNEGGYDNDLLQSLMHTQVAGKLQRQIACSACPRLISRPDLSFSGGLFGAHEPQDYDNDAIVVHMGCFDVPDAHRVEHEGGQTSDSNSDSPTTNEGGLEVTLVSRTASKARMARSVRKRALRHKLHLYSIAAPGMRKWPDHFQGLSSRLCWADPVSIKPGWQQTQKGYFEAPSASQVDLLVTSSTEGNQRSSLGVVTVVFATVENGTSFEARHNHQECHALHKAIMKVMQQQLKHLPGRDGYISRSEESEFGYMIAFEQPHKAVQWCLLVQEALMYVSWPSYVLSHPGFEEVLCPVTGLPLFRGPRLRMGIAEGQPTAVLPDHNGRANYYGGSVNSAARYMDAAAHGGQVVASLDLVRKLVMNWVAQDREDKPVENQIGEDLSSPDVSRSCSSKPTILAGRPSAQLAIPAGAADDNDTKIRDQLDLKAKQPEQPARMPVVLTQQQTTSTSQALLLQQLVSRSNSETAAAGGTSGQSINWLPTHVEDMVTDVKPAGRSRSFTAGLWLYSGNRSRNPRRLGHYTGQRALSGLGKTAAAMALAAGKSAAVSEPDCLIVWHLGRFTFKGSGESDMVQLLHTAIADRTFPAEPPRGKGCRISGEGSDSVVEDLPVVRLKVPRQLAMARMAFRVTGFQLKNKSLS